MDPYKWSQLWNVTSECLSCSFSIFEEIQNEMQEKLKVKIEKSLNLPC